MSAQLRSNDGESVLVPGLEARATYATDPGFESSIRISGRHSDGDHTHALEFSVAGIWLREDDFRDLRDVVATWLARPLRDLTPDSLNGEFQLARLPGQSVLIRFGSRSDVDDRRNAIVTISILAGQLSCEFHFPCDQSCLEASRREMDLSIDVAG